MCAGGVGRLLRWCPLLLKLLALVLAMGLVLPVVPLRTWAFAIVLLLWHLHGRNDQDGNNNNDDKNNKRQPQRQQHLLLLPQQAAIKRGITLITISHSDVVNAFHHQKLRLWRPSTTTTTSAEGDDGSSSRNNNNKDLGWKLEALQAVP